MLLYSSSQPIFDSTKAFAKDPNITVDSVEDGSVLTRSTEALAGAWQTDNSHGVETTHGVKVSDANDTAGTEFVGIARIPVISSRLANTIARIDEFTVPKYVKEKKPFGKPGEYFTADDLTRLGATEIGTTSNPVVGQELLFKFPRNYGSMTTPTVRAQTAGTYAAAATTVTAGGPATWTINSTGGYGAGKNLWIDIVDRKGGAANDDITARTILSTVGDKIEFRYTYKPKLEELDTNLFHEYGLHQGIGHYENPITLEQWERANMAVYTEGRFITTMFDVSQIWSTGKVVKLGTDGKFTTGNGGTGSIIDRITVWKAPSADWPFLGFEMAKY